MLSIELNREELSRRTLTRTLQEKLNGQIGDCKSIEVASRLTEVLGCFCLPPALIDELCEIRKNTKDSLQSVKVRTTVQTLEDRKRVNKARNFINGGLLLFSQPGVRIGEIKIDMLWPNFLDMNVEGTRPMYKFREVEVRELYKAPWVLRPALSMQGLPTSKVQICHEKRPYIAGIEGFRGWARGSWGSSNIHTGTYRMEEEKTRIILRDRMRERYSKK